MIKRTCAYLLTSLMLVTTVPAAVPAMQVSASVHDQVAGTAVTSAKNTVKLVKKGGKVYCRNAKNAVVKGWVSISGKWYYFDKKDGHMITGWLKLKKNKKFYLKKDGTMIEGPCWYKIGSKKYLFTKNGHVRAAWLNKKGKWYFIDTEGNAVKGKWLLYGKKYYYFTSGGVAATGVKMIKGKKYTFDSSCALKGKVPASVKKEAKATAAFISSGSEAVVKTAAASVPSSAAKNTQSTAAKAQTTAVKTESNTAGTAGSAAKPEGAATTATAASTTASGSTKAASGASTAAAKSAITKVVGKLNDLPESKKNFTINIAKYVRKYAPKYGIKVYSPIIAQAIHESGWGESSLAWKYHNYFGLKCGTLWTGKSVNLSTKEEYTAGSLTTIRDNFRVYDNMEQGVIGYFEFIQRPRYANLKGVTSCKQYLINIKNDGYATGSQYVSHTMNVVNLYNLTQFDK